MNEEKNSGIVALTRALILVAGEIENPPKTATNPHYKSKFAPLDDLLTYVRPLLTKHGIVMVQTTEVGEHGPVLVTHLIHKDGAEMNSRYPLAPVKNDPQGMGAAVTYARRYALCAILGIVGDSDDDGNVASSVANVQKRASKTGEAVQKKPEWSKEQQEEIGNIFRDIIALGKEQGDAEIAKLRQTMKYDAPSDVIDEAAKLLAKWQDINAAAAAESVAK